MCIHMWSNVNLTSLLDAGPGLAQTRDSRETVTIGNRDTRGNAGNAGAVETNVLWNNQYAVLADEN